MRTANVLAGGILGLALVCQGTVVHAQAAVDAAIQRGIALRLRHQEADALTEFQAAWEGCHCARAAGHMGLTEQSLNRWVGASEHIHEALAADSDPWVVRHRSELEEALDRLGAHVGSVMVETNVPGAVVTLNNRPVARFPVTVEVSRITVTASAAGYVTESRTVDVDPRGNVRLDLRLAPTGTQSTGTASTGTPAGTQVGAVTPHPTGEPSEGSTAPVGALPGTQPVGAPARGGVQRAVGWTSVALAGASVAGAVVALTLRDHAAAQWNDPSVCGPPPGQTLMQACGGTLDAEHTYHGLMVGAWVAAGVLGATGVVLLATVPHGTERVALSCGPGLGPGLVCTGRF